MPRFSDEIFHDAFDLPTEERPAFLDRECGLGTELRAEVEALLEVADTRPDVLSFPRPLGWHRTGTPLGLDPNLETGSSGPSSAVHGTPRPPERLGRYRIIEELGRGGMGVVYRAEDTELRREIALKILYERGTGPVDPERLRQEARLAASLNHPGIATVYSLDQDSGFWFFTMELVSGPSLAEIIDDGRLDPDQTMSIALQLAKAIEFAHAAGVVHRDLKPANVVVSSAGDAKILDFGIAKEIGGPNSAPVPSARKGTTIRGTPDYMSPEQILGLSVDSRSDIWSFGAVVFECLTGRKAAKALAEARGDASQLEAKIPGGLAGIISSCLSVTLEDRPQSIAEVRSRLEHLSSDSGSWWQRPMPLASMILIIAAVIVVSWLAFSSAPGPLATVQLTEDGVLQAEDTRGQRTWTRVLPGTTARNIKQVTAAGVIVTRPLPIYRENGSPVAVLVATASPAGSHHLHFLDPTDGHEIWKRPGSWTPPSGKPDVLPAYRWQTLAAWPEPDTVIVSMLGAGQWYPAAIEFLTPSQELLGNYYHPGYLYFYDQLDLDGDGAPSIVLFGDNSSARLVREIVPFSGDAHCGAVVALRPGLPLGEGFPYSHPDTEGRDWPEMEKAQEEVYVLIPPMVGDVWADVVDMYGYGDPKQFEVTCKDGRIYYLDSELRPTRCHLSARSRADSLHFKENVPVPPVIHVAEGGEWEFLEVPLQ